MKFKTFRALIFGGAGLLVGGGLLGSCLLCAKSPPPSRQTSTQGSAMLQSTAARQTPSVASLAITSATASATAGPVPSAQVLPKGSLPLRPMDRDILQRLGQAASTDKIKDVFSDKPYKVSFYRDPGQSQFNRLKLDLNRNEKWDEKWTIERQDGQQKVRRQVAPSDDERYTVEYRLSLDSWKLKED